MPASVGKKTVFRHFAWAAAATTALMMGVTAHGSVAHAAGAPEPAAVNVPIPDGDIAAVVRELGLVETDKPVKELVAWRKPTKAIVFVDNNVNRLAWMQKAAPGVKLVAVHNNKEALAEIADADAQVGGFCTKELVKAGKNLRWVHNNHAGVEQCFSGDVPAELMSGKILVTNQKRTFGPEIANSVIAMGLALNRGLDLYTRMNAEGRFDRKPIPVARFGKIQGATMLVVGLGGIGTNVAELAHAMGMRVIATRNSSHEGPAFVEYVGLADELPKLIGQADFVALTAPLTKETTKLFDAAMFARMKKGAIFLNVARGEEVVQEDLAAALSSGQVGGAGLDVTVPEPLPDGHPLFKAPNVIITPHVSGRQRDDEGREYSGSQGELAWQVTRENLRRYVNGEKMFSQVNPKFGY